MRPKSRKTPSATDNDPGIRVAVLGLGNPVLCDDSVGLRVAAEVERILRRHPIPGVTVMASVRAGFELIDLVSGFTHAIIIDSLESTRPTPGLIRRLDLNGFSGSSRLVGVHDICIADAFELAATLGIRMPASVEIYAVEGEDMKTLTEEMTPAVEASVIPLAREVHARAGELVRAPCPHGDSPVKKDNVTPQTPFREHKE